MTPVRPPQDRNTPSQAITRPLRGCLIRRMQVAPCRSSSLGFCGALRGGQHRRLGGGNGEVGTIPGRGRLWNAAA